MASASKHIGRLVEGDARAPLTRLVAAAAGDAESGAVGAPASEQAASLTVLDPSAPGDGRHGRVGRGTTRRRVLAFFVGGVTMSEWADLQRWGRSAKPPREVIVGGTCLLERETLMRDMARIGREARSRRR